MQFIYTYFNTNKQGVSTTTIATIISQHMKSFHQFLQILASQSGNVRFFPHLNKARLLSLSQETEIPAGRLAFFLTEISTQHQVGLKVSRVKIKPFFQTWIHLKGLRIQLWSSPITIILSTCNQTCSFGLSYPLRRLQMDRSTCGEKPKIGNYQHILSRA